MKKLLSTGILALSSMGSNLGAAMAQAQTPTSDSIQSSDSQTTLPNLAELAKGGSIAGTGSTTTQTKKEISFIKSVLIGFGALIIIDLINIGLIIIHTKEIPKETPQSNFTSHELLLKVE